MYDFTKDFDRWGNEANVRRLGRQSGKNHMGLYAQQFGETLHKSLELQTVTEPQYLQSIGDNRALKITQAFMDEIKTRWLICPMSQKFTVTGMVYWADQIKKDHKRRHLYMAGGIVVTTLCVNPKRGVWKIYIRIAE
jgi:hypothetical protein